MNLERRIPWIVALLVVLAIAVAACERPLTSEEDQGELPTPIIITSQAVSESVPATETISSPEDVPTDDTPAEETEAEVVEEQTVEATEVPTVEATQEPEVEATATEEPEQVEEAGEEPEEESGSPEGDNTDVGDVVVEEDESTSEPVDGGTGEGGESEAPVPATHTVAGGETLYRISLLYGISWVDLANYNNIVNPNSIYPGQVLLIPGGEDSSSEEAPPPVEPPSEFTDYAVQPGDTLSLIGLRFGVSWVEIAEANGIVNPNQIYTGQILKIPVSTPGPSPEFTHVVQPGESILSISLIYGIPWLSIASANNIESPYLIEPGQSLVIPGG